MYQENGSVSIHAENIFPIIKKWLYSEKDIFIRELVSNASDAISKLQKLDGMGEANIDSSQPFEIQVIVNQDEKTIRVIDNGVGMTRDEVKKYINQVAFSGAKDFIEKYKDKTDENQIIGHFGLGFYSAFMVSSKVQIDTRSFKETEGAVRWTSEGGTEFEMEESDRTERGTTITLYIAEDSEEFLSESTMRTTLMKYFSFLPYALFLTDTSKAAIEKRAKEQAEALKKKEEKARAKSETENKDMNDSVAEEGEVIDYEDTSFLEEDSIEKPLNDTQPLWLKNPKECTEEEYRSFYKKVFQDFQDPLFWIHLNMDYPFRLKGILYFPRLKNGFEGMEGQIKLYYNQVFVADNIKEVIPEFLLLLKGTLDCPDLPLNVSRSFLQNDGYVSKISSHITKKVADKLKELFENERESYNQYWEDINPFVKYGCIREQKFFDRVKDILVYKTIQGETITLKDYLESAKEVHENKVFYVTDEKQQALYVRTFKENNLKAILLNTIIDNHFIQTMEMKETGVQFLRIDADISSVLKENEAVEISKADQDKMEQMFKTVLGNDKIKVKLEALKAKALPVMILQDEHMRRFVDMNMLRGNNKEMMGMFTAEQTIVVNANHDIIQSLLTNQEQAHQELIVRHLYDLARLSQGQLDPEEMHQFMDRNNQILSTIVKGSH